MLATLFLSFFLSLSSHDQQLNFWVSLSLLIQHRTSLLSEQVVMLPESLSKLTIQTKKEASVLVNRAKKLYRSQASSTCRAQLHDFTSRKIGMDSLDYHQLLHQNVLRVSEAELVKACYGGDIKLTRAATNASGTIATVNATPAPIKFFILDCRPIEQYEAGHLPCAYHLDPELVRKQPVYRVNDGSCAVTYAVLTLALFSCRPAHSPLLQLNHPNDLSERIDSLSSMKGCHFCFLGEGGEQPVSLAELAGQPPTGASQPQVTVVAAPSTRSSAVVKALIQMFLKKG